MKKLITLFALLCTAIVFAAPRSASTTTYSSRGGLAGTSHSTRSSGGTINTTYHDGRGRLEGRSTTTHSGNNTTTTYYEGIGGVDIELSKPGLQFYGEDDENHTEELKTLEKMGKYFTGSSWELAILKRMEEISNGQ